MSGVVGVEGVGRERVRKWKSRRVEGWKRRENRVEVEWCLDPSAASRKRRGSLVPSASLRAGGMTDRKKRNPRVADLKIGRYITQERPKSTA
jgi:hypothetical protein